MKNYTSNIEGFWFNLELTIQGSIMTWWVACWYGYWLLAMDKCSKANMAIYKVCIRPLLVAMAIAYGLWLLVVAFLLWLLPIACGYCLWLLTIGYCSWQWLLATTYEYLHNGLLWKKLFAMVITYGYFLWLLATNYGYLHNGLLCLQLLAMDKGIGYRLSPMAIGYSYWLLVILGSDFFFAFSFIILALRSRVFRAVFRFEV